MNGIESKKTECDECGKSVDRITRRFNGQRYCATCYKRMFEKRKCPRCGKETKLHKRHQDAVCRECEKDRPCIRCGKEHYNIGKITQYGPVCDSCSVHYREPKACERCGRPSKRLSKYLPHGVSERICPRCANSLRGNCSMCSRNRFLIDAGDGSMICPKCRDEGHIHCPSCGNLYPAGYGKQCRNCYYRGLLERKVTIDIAGFETDGMRLIFRKYADWLLRINGAEKAAMTVNKHFGFFQHMEERWGEVPGFDTLLEFYGAEGLRRHRLPIRFLGELDLVQISATEKRNDSERRRIESIVGEFKGSEQARIILVNYRDCLLEAIEASELAINTARLYLRAAADLLSESESWPLAQSDVDGYLNRRPGQRASLTKFISYLRSQCGLDLNLLEVKQKRRGAGNPATERKLVRLIKEAGEMASYSDPQILAVSMAYYHGVSPTLLSDFGSSLAQRDGGFVVTLKQKEYWLPPLEARV